MTKAELIKALSRVGDDEEIYITYHHQDYCGRVELVSPEFDEQFVRDSNGAFFLAESEEDSENYNDGIAVTKWVLS